VAHLAFGHMEFPPPARDPLRIALAAATLVQGLSLALGGPAPGTIEGIIAPVLVWVWAIGLSASGFTLILAALWRDVLTGILIELAGCVFAVLTIGAYVSAAFGKIGAEALVAPVLVTAGYGVGCAFRIGGIIRDLHKYQITLDLIRDRRRAAGR
jgi:hypothetical protein